MCAVGFLGLIASAFVSEFTASSNLSSLYWTMPSVDQQNANKRLVWEDMLAVLERLGHEITAKQRGYFLTK